MFIHVKNLLYTCTDITSNVHTELNCDTYITCLILLFILFFPVGWPAGWDWLLQAVTPLFKHTRLIGISRVCPSPGPLSPLGLGCGPEPQVQPPPV